MDHGKDKGWGAVQDWRAHRAAGPESEEFESEIAVRRTFGDRSSFQIYRVIRTGAWTDCTESTEFIVTDDSSRHVFKEQTLGTLTIDDAGQAHFTPHERSDVIPNDPFDLRFVRTAFGLSDEELADLFKIRRSSLAGWREHRIPLGRRATVARLVELARVLVRDVRHERLPEIVRTPDAWLGGKTILQTIADDGPDAVYAYLHRLFSYA